MHNQQMKVVRKTNTTNEKTITDLQTKISALENQLKIQKEINTRLIESQVNVEPSNDSTTNNIEPGVSTPTIQGETNLGVEDEATNTSNLLQKCQKKLKLKIKELNQANSLVKHLDDIVGNVRNENTSSLKNHLDASRAELDRFRRLNDVPNPHKENSLDTETAVSGLNISSLASRLSIIEEKTKKWDIEMEKVEQFNKKCF